MTINIPDMLTAVGALGTASYGLVDGSKAICGGISNAGFIYIKRVILWLFPGDASVEDHQTPLALGAVLATLKANWLNGTPLVDQRAIAKSLIKLRLNTDNAGFLAQRLGVNPDVLSSSAKKIDNGDVDLTKEEADVFGRFDLILTTALDEGYQRADQRYRNWCKVMAVPVSLTIAVLGGWTIHPTHLCNYIHSSVFGQALISGLVATPLAPIAKDISSAIQAGAKAVQAFRR